MIVENTFVPTDWGLYSGILVFVLIFAMFLAGGVKKKLPAIILGVFAVASFIFWWTFELDEPHDIKVYLAIESGQGIKINQHFLTAGSEYQYPDGRKVKLAMADASSKGSAYSNTQSVVINETSEDLWMTNVNAGVSRGEEAVLTDLTPIKPGGIKEFSHMIDTKSSARRSPPTGAYYNPDRKEGEDFYWLNWVNHYYQVNVLKYSEGELSQELVVFKEGDEFTFGNGETFTMPLRDNWQLRRIINDTGKTLSIYNVTYYQYYWAIDENPPRLKDSFLPWSRSSVDYDINIIASRKVGPPEEIKRSEYTMQATLTWLTWDED